MDLIAGEFRLRELTGNHNRSALGIYLDRMLIGGFERQEKQGTQHFNYVVIGMFVVIEQDDVVERKETFGFRGPGLRGDGRGCQRSNGRMKWKGGATDSTGLHPSWEVVPGSELP